MLSKSCKSVKLFSFKLNQKSELNIKNVYFLTIAAAITKAVMEGITHSK